MKREWQRLMPTTLPMLLMTHLLMLLLMMRTATISELQCRWSALPAALAPRVQLPTPLHSHVP